MTAAAGAQILLYPDPRLKQVSAPAQSGDLDRVGALLEATIDGLGHCVGLAAPQLGELVRVIAVDVSGHRKVADGEHNGRLVLANPRIVSAQGSDVGREGCLSIPEMTANVRRARTIVVEHSAGTVRSSGFEARCLQHEIDHLDGVLFLDRVASLVDDVFRRKTYAASEGGMGGGSGTGSPRSSSES